MRDPKRIPELLSLLGQYWNQFPDLRLGQMLVNFGIDYFTEDQRFIEKLQLRLYGDESFDAKVERIAKAWFERPCPPEEGACNPDLHNWAKGHPDDKAAARNTVAFVLKEARG